MNRIVLISCTLVLFAASCEPAEERLFTRYYEPFDLQLEADAAMEAPELNKAAAAYRAGDYAKVVELTEAYQATGYRIPKVMMGQSIAYIETGQWEKAIKNLEDLKWHPFYREPANWYLALLHLRAGEREKAEENLRVLLENPGSPYYQRAAEIMRDW